MYPYIHLYVCTLYSVPVRIVSKGSKQQPTLLLSVLPLNILTIPCRAGVGIPPVGA